LSTIELAYTAVAFGELARLDEPIPEDGGSLMAEQDDPTEETDVGGGPPEGVQTGPSEPVFDVTVLEDDISDPGEENSRIRVFHAVPDVETVNVFDVTERAEAVFCHRNHRPVTDSVCCESFPP